MRRLILFLAMLAMCVPASAQTHVVGAPASTIAAGTTGPTVIKSTGLVSLFGVVSDSTGTASVTFYDNASACSGTILYVTPATTSVGQIFALPPIWAVNGITACGASGSPALTVITGT